ncbi:hypothetical protein R1flu_000238 [Riccia fluitans]|uniref:Uncharacterized protein n=1 Tax=Riccia fluitans TaxID=41844 RepID=A0ABD1XZV1_9MARC
MAALPVHSRPAAIHTSMYRYTTTPLLKACALAPEWRLSLSAEPGGPGVQVLFGASHVFLKYHVENFEVLSLRIGNFWDFLHLWRRKAKREIRKYRSFAVAMDVDLWGNEGLSSELQSAPPALPECHFNKEPNGSNSFECPQTGLSK